MYREYFLNTIHRSVLEKKILSGVSNSVRPNKVSSLERTLYSHG